MLPVAQKFLARWPIMLALVFCAYSSLLLWNAFHAKEQLREAAEARIVADSKRRAAGLSDFAAERRNDAVELADSHGIEVYLLNRALGMSLRYGLKASLDAIEDRFRHQLGQRMLGGDKLYSRALFLDEDGEVLVDLAPEDGPIALSTTGLRDGPHLIIDLPRRQFFVTAPVLKNDKFSGAVVVVGDAEQFSRYVISSAARGQYREFLLTTDGHDLSQDNGLDTHHPGHESDFASLPNNALAPIMRNVGSGNDLGAFSRFLAIRTAVEGAPLSLVTVFDEREVYGQFTSSSFLYFASAFPLFILLGAVFFDRLLRHNQELQADVAERTAALWASRRRLKAISDCQFEGVLVVDAQGVVVFANPSAMRQLGGPVLCAASDTRQLDGRPVPSTLSTGPAPLEGRPLDHIVKLASAGGEHTISFAQGPWLQVLNQGKPHRQDDAVFITAAGQSLMVAYACAPLDNTEDGRAAVVSFRDISALKDAQRESMQASKLASVGQLAAGIAHEINTPSQYIGDNLLFIGDAMNAMSSVIDESKNLLDAVRSDPDLAPQVDRMKQAMEAADVDFLRSDARGAVDDALAGIGQISKIVLSMKEFSHPGSTHKGAANINRALENTLNVTRNLWKHVAEADLNFAPDLPPVPCFASELNQVFLNLIVNAVHAIESSGKKQPGRIAIATKVDGAFVEIQVADSGLGVPLAIRDRIFEPFFTTKPVGQGSGQGLAICRDVVVVKHGGSINVSGVEGEGAVFTVRLPLEA